jgi:hypothetical protein
MLSFHWTGSILDWAVLIATVAGVTIFIVGQLWIATHPLPKRTRRFY